MLLRRIASADETSERLSRPVALAVFASDALSSVAYATQETLIVLVPAIGVAAYTAQLPLAGCVVALLAVLVVSYRQTVRAYPNAGGAYVVSRDNFGPAAAQVAGVALLIDYILTVSVSAAAGVAAADSAIPSLQAHRLPLAVLVVWVVAGVNLLGVRSSGRLFAAPTYAFIAAMAALIGVGVWRAATGSLAPSGAPAASSIAGHATLLVMLRGFAVGCTAMTGVEAISNGVPALRPVEWRHARTVLVWLGVLLGTMFVGVSLLAARVRPDVSAGDTVLSQIARAVFGASTLGVVGYAFVQAATVAILVLAANTSFADFPRLASFQARDHYLSASFRHRGRRLAFSRGIIVLAALATSVLVLTGADVTRLIPLYAVGVFLAFTMSQAGMVRHHLRHRERGWRRGAVVNGTGTVATSLVLAVVVVTKFAEGAWVVTVLLPVAVLALLAGNRHSQRVRHELSSLPLPPEGEAPLLLDAGKHRRHLARRMIRAAGRAGRPVRATTVDGAQLDLAVVLVGELVEPARRTLLAARSVAPRVEALHVAIELDDDVAGVRSAWTALAPDVALEVVQAPYRDVVDPIASAFQAGARPTTRHVAAVLGVVIPHPRLLLAVHNRRARPIIDTLVQAGVDVVVVPEPLGRRRVSVRAPVADTPSVTACADHHASGTGTESSPARSVLRPMSSLPVPANSSSGTSAARSRHNL